MTFWIGSCHSVPTSEWLIIGKIGLSSCEILHCNANLQLVSNNQMVDVG